MRWPSSCGSAGCPAHARSIAVSASCRPGRLLEPVPERDELPEPRPYWSPRAAAEALATDPFTGSLDDAATALEGLLTDAVSRRMVADVPLGALLSGGVNSTLVVALMQRMATQPVRGIRPAGDALRGRGDLGGSALRLV